MDEVDSQQERDAILNNIQLKEIQSRADAIPAGNPGMCVVCDEHSKRLVNEVCARCRDKYNLP
jgi:hypothetical protein